MRARNFTDLVERQDTPWPASSEHFWTTLFALFALHRGVAETPQEWLTIWHATDGSKKTSYVPRAKSPTLQLSAMSFDSIAIEPRALTKPWPGTRLVLPAAAGGFSPDVVMQSGAGHFVVIENKVTSGACLADNQLENYPRLVQWLMGEHLSFDFLLLQSAGCGEALAKQARDFQKKPWADNFGILLWEEVLRKMAETGFAPVGLPIQEWQEYSAALETDCVSPGA